MFDWIVVIIQRNNTNFPGGQSFISYAIDNKFISERKKWD